MMSQKLMFSNWCTATWMNTIPPSTSFSCNQALELWRATSTLQTVLLKVSLISLRLTNVLAFVFPCCCLIAKGRCFYIEACSRTYYLACESNEDFERWTSVLAEIVQCLQHQEEKLKKTVNGLNWITLYFCLQCSTRCIVLLLSPCPFFTPSLYCTVWSLSSLSLSVCVCGSPILLFSLFWWCCHFLSLPLSPSSFSSLLPLFFLSSLSFLWLFVLVCACLPYP